VKTQEIWRCPSDWGPYRGAGPDADWWGAQTSAQVLKPFKDWIQWGTNEKVGVSYGYRGTNDAKNGSQDQMYQIGKDVAAGQWPNNGGRSVAGYQLSDVKSPSERWLFWDHRPWHFNSPGSKGSDRNNAKTQVLAFDTHVTTLSNTQLNTEQTGLFNDLRK
jgi:hypothetical protein